MFGYKKKYKRVKAKIDLIGHRDFLRISTFNKWFCDDTKPTDIYAHSGIYLRGDKLSGQHILQYWQSLTNIDDDLLHELSNDLYFMVSLFEREISTNWAKQRHT